MGMGQETTGGLSREVLEQVRKSQLDEAIGAEGYAYMAGRERNPENRRILERMSADEAKHEAVWRGITGQEAPSHGGAVFLVKLLTVVFGFTFTLKYLEKGEQLGQEGYERLARELPEAARMHDDERRHEAELESMLDEERLHYVGAMVLGLNDALVELTGAIAGVTFSLANTRLVALTGIVTGIAATLSMAASNYLAETAEGADDAVKSSLYTGIAYLATVALLVLPYLLFPEDMYVAAFVVMIATVIVVIAVFNYYVSVATDVPFGRRFAQMAAVSLGVAAISFLIGIAAKGLLGIDV
jgi:VIT1/CCC1 family predicted Fe2+/Mn2+ transporter